MEPAEQIDSVDALLPKLAEILGNGPLYRRFVYRGRGCHSSSPGGGIRYGTLPSKLKMFCEKDHCRIDTWWDVDSQSVQLRDAFINMAVYRCRNCGESNTSYYFIWHEHPEYTMFVKVGQYPELEERVPESLAQALGSTDLKLYKNALRMRNFNLGLAAVAYMRRVVENRMGDMLDILHEAAIAHNAAPEVLERHQGMKKEKRFSVKICG